jgi:hypothetical protein
MCVQKSRLEQMCVAGVVICIQFAIGNYFQDTRTGLYPVLVLYRISRELSYGSFSTAAIMAHSLTGVCTILKRCARTHALGVIFRVSRRNFCIHRNTLAPG